MTTEEDASLGTRKQAVEQAAEHMARADVERVLIEAYAHVLEMAEGLEEENRQGNWTARTRLVYRQGERAALCHIGEALLGEAWAWEVLPGQARTLLERKAASACGEGPTLAGPLLGARGVP